MSEDMLVRIVAALERIAPALEGASIAEPPTGDLLSVKDVALLLDVPVATVYAWNHRGNGPMSVKVGKHRRDRVTDVERWLTSRESPQ